MLLYCNVILSQWVEHEVTNNANTPHKVISADLDNDFNMDIVSLDRGSNTIKWYPNSEGQGIFGITRLLGNLEEGRDIASGDIDNDSDLDVIAVSAETTSGNPQMVLFRNLDGLGNYDIGQAISTPNTIANGSVSLDIGDVDGDNDLDIVVAISSAGDGSITVYRNTNGNGDFDTGTVLAYSQVNGSGLALDDIDGDKDLDILAGTSVVGGINLFRNQDGLGNFASPTTFGSPGLGVLHLSTGDIDGDNDIDVLGSTPFNDMIVWWENLDGLGTFGTERVIIDDWDNPNDVLLTDLDNDEDLDVLAVFGLPPGNLVWFENLDGFGTFSALELISNAVEFAITVAAADLDGDGDNDAITASQSQQFVKWYENPFLGVPEFKRNEIHIIPNPASSIIRILSQEKILKVSIYDLLGRELLSVLNDIEEINIGQLPEGFLIIKVSSENGTFVKKLLKE